MPYLLYPSLFLTLPLEIRHEIYSYLLIDDNLPHLIPTNLFRNDAARRAVYNIFLVCRKVYSEAFQYYYSKNVFLVSLCTPRYNLKDVIANSNLLARQLQHVQALHLIIEVPTKPRIFGESTAEPAHLGTEFQRQIEQWSCFLGCLSKSKGRQAERLLKDLIIEDWPPRRIRPIRQPYTNTYLMLEEVEKTDRVFPLLSALPKERIGRIRIIQSSRRALP